MIKNTLQQAVQLGSSASLFSALRIAYDHFDILQDDEVRQGLKTFSNWPTFPQLYIKGEFVGGLDIVKVSRRAAGGRCTNGRIGPA